MTIVVGLYITNKYQIKDQYNIYYKVYYIGPLDIKTLEVFITKDINIFNKTITKILDLGDKEKRINNILRGIIKELQEEE